jgi:hypothetical protein
MSRGRRSIGVDDATGQPASAPRGPYITDEDDGTTPPRKRRSSRDAGAKADESRAKKAPRKKDLASRRKGPAQP